jgi:Sec-independent protein translocase protein TatA
MAVAIVSEHRIFKKATAVAKVTKRTRYARVSLDEQNKKKKKDKQSAQSVHHAKQKENTHTKAHKGAPCHKRRPTSCVSQTTKLR